MTLPKKDTQFFLSKVVEFLTCKDPLLEMLQWLLSVFMEAEASLKVGADKNQHNKEIRRRKKVVGVFPSRDSYIRLVTTYVLEYTEDGITDRAYFSPESIRAMEPVFKEHLQKLAT